MKLLRIHYLVNRTPKENYSQSENAYSLQSPERNQKWEALCLAIKAALALEMRWLNPSLSTPNSSVWLLPSRWWGQQEASRTSGVSHYRYVKGIAPLWTLLLPWRSNKESLWTWFWKAGPTGILGAQDTEEYWTGRWKWSPTEADRQCGNQGTERLSGVWTWNSPSACCCTEIKGNLPSTVPTPTTTCVTLTRGFKKQNQKAP